MTAIKCIAGALMFSFIGLFVFLKSGPSAALAKNEPPSPAAQDDFDQAAALAKLREEIKGKEQQPAETVFKNIQSMKGVPAGRLLAIMEFGYARSLGVNCTYCHTPDNWASEDKTKKQIARDMSAMVGRINNELLAGIKDLKGPKATINCTTCHRGEVKPALNLPAPSPAPTPTASNDKKLSVPKGTKIIFDGSVEPDEWKDASQHSLKGGGILRLKHDGKNLFVGIKGATPGFGHLCLTGGENIYVLHASAALGWAVFKKTATGYEPTQKFTWSMRDVSMSEAAVAAREKYLADNGWVADVKKMGAENDREFIIGGKFMNKSGIQLAVVYASDPKSPQYFPENLADGTIAEKLIFGSTPADLSFNAASWAQLQLAQC